MLRPVSKSREVLVRRFLELAPHLGKIRSARVDEIEASALSIGIDYSKESSGGNRLPAAMSVVERLEGDAVLRSARELQALFDEAWPLLDREHTAMVRLHVWEGHSEARYLARALGHGDNWVIRAKRSCLADFWHAMDKAIRRNPSLCTGKNGGRKCRNGNAS